MSQWPVSRRFVPLDWLSQGDRVFVCTFLLHSTPTSTPPPQSSHPGACLLCPQPMSALPWEGLTLLSVQLAVHRMFPRRCFRPPAGQDPGVQGGGGVELFRGGGGPCQGMRMRVGAGKGLAQQVPPHSCPASHFLGASPGQGWTK